MCLSIENVFGLSKESRFLAIRPLLKFTKVGEAEPYRVVFATQKTYLEHHCIANSTTSAQTLPVRGFVTFLIIENKSVYLAR